MSTLFDTSILSRYVLPDAETRFSNVVSIVNQAIGSEGLYISSVTVYELRRGVRKLLLQGRGRRKAIELEKLLRSAYVVWSPRVWDLAAEIWAAGQVAKPSIVLSEGDVLIAATALAFERMLVTADQALAANLLSIRYQGAVDVLEMQTR